MDNPFKPDPTLLIQLGSIAVHMDEMLETNFKNIEFDLPAVRTLLDDEEVKAWVKVMTKGAFLPLKRSAR